MHLGNLKLQQFFRDVCVILHANSVEKQLLNFRNAFVSHCIKNSSLTIIWNNLGLSNYKNKTGNLEFREKTPVIIQKGII